MMAIIAGLATAAAATWSLVVWLSTDISAAPHQPPGGCSTAVAWLIVAVLWLMAALV